MNPIKKHPWFSIFFLLVIIAEFIGLSGFPQVRLASKGMIMASLVSYYIMNAKRQNHVFLLGMIFALLGDAFLLFEGNDFFMIGLGCFLVMQLCYSTTFYKKRRIPRNTDKVIAGLICLIPIIFFSLTWGMLGALRIPVLIYGVAITAMLITAYLRHPKLIGYTWVVVGAILFTISDAVLAYGKFVQEVGWLPYVVMGTYITAQYLITTGVVAEDYKRDENTPAMEGSFGRHKM